MASYLNTQNPNMVQQSGTACPNCQNSGMSVSQPDGATIYQGTQSELWQMSQMSDMQSDAVMPTPAAPVSPGEEVSYIAADLFPNGMGDGNMSSSGQMGQMNQNNGEIVVEPGRAPIYGPNYLINFLRSQIGRLVEVQFLMGSGGMAQRSGRLVVVGNNYIVLEEAGRHAYVACDYYSIKFVRVMTP